MNWEAVIRGAQVGCLIGAANGLVPLATGYLCKKSRLGVHGFLACLIGGAVGGLPAAVAVMGLTTAQILQPDQSAKTPMSNWSRLATTSDKLWYAVAALLIVASLGVCMFASAAYLTPLILGVPNSTPRGAIGKVVDLSMLFVSSVIGFLIGIAVLSVICRRFISFATHKNWAEDFERSSHRHLPVIGKIVRWYQRAHLPTNWPLGLDSSSK